MAAATIDGSEPPVRSAPRLRAAEALDDHEDACFRSVALGKRTDGPSLVSRAHRAGGSINCCAFDGARCRHGDGGPHLGVAPQGPERHVSVRERRLAT